MNMVKRGISLLLSAVLLTLVVFSVYAIPSGDVDVPADDIFGNEILEGLQYVITGAEATVTGYTGTQTELVLPMSAGGVPLTGIASGALQDTQLISVTIPASVQQIGAGALAAPTMTAIYVESGNEVYAAKDGVLYNQKITCLVQLPATYEGAFFLPDTVERIASGALLNCSTSTTVFSKNADLVLEDQTSGIAVHFGLQAGRCDHGCLLCLHCGHWFTAAGEAAPAHYTASFYDRQNVRISSYFLHEGEIARLPAVEESYTDATYYYGFVGWSPEIGPCTEDTVYTAMYEIRGYTGDFNGDGKVNDRDPIYLLRAFLGMPGFVLNQPGDMDDDGIWSDEDAVYLLRNILFPSLYPLHPSL